MYIILIFKKKTLIENNMTSFLCYYRLEQHLHRLFSKRTSKLYLVNLAYNGHFFSHIINDPFKYPLNYQYCYRVPISLG